MPAPQQPPVPFQGLSRRRALVGLGGLGLATPVLAACGGGGSGDPEAPAPTVDGPLAATADLPVGGGVVLADARIVLTRPTQGEVLGFTAVCPHAQCVVGQVTDGAIVCNCHGSRFSITTGEVEQGPATEPLTPVEVTVDGGQVSLA